MDAVAPKVASTDDELLQAEAELWCHAFAYLKSIALQCAIKLGIPNAIHSHGGAASLSELHATLPIAPSRRPCLARLMRFLATSGIFQEESASDAEAAGGPCYRLTPLSRLLVAANDDGNTGSVQACLSQLILLPISPFHFRACQRLSEWLQKEDEDATTVTAETPFTMEHGASLYRVVSQDEEFGPCFNEAMVSDSRFVAAIVVRECGEMFAGVTSLVDVGGGDGTMARAIAKAFPHVRCSVLELPHVIEAMPADDTTVEHVVGDMMQFIPQADAVLLKMILHNWSDEDCVRILKRSREAISTREPQGKLIIIDFVVGSSKSSKHMLEAQLYTDLCMMTLTTGEERDEGAWRRIFLDAGFTRYKIIPILGIRSVIEVYP